MFLEVLQNLQENICQSLFFTNFIEWENDR